jgi:hypothetical protein
MSSRSDLPESGAIASELRVAKSARLAGGSGVGLEIVPSTKVTKDRTPAGYFSFAYSALASFRMGMSDR